MEVETKSRTAVGHWGGEKREDEKKRERERPREVEKKREKKENEIGTEKES